MASIDLKPQVLDLSLYAGDGVEFRLICTDNDGDPLNVSGNITAQIRVDRSETSSAIVDFDANLIEEVNQVRRYRNWVAHGRRTPQPAAVTPATAYDRLKRFLDHLG